MKKRINNGLKKIIIAYGGTLLILAIICILVFTAYNRKLREKEATKSKLDNIKGIGIKRKQELLKTFGSIEGIKKANIEEITKINGINTELARKIKEKLD